MTTRHTTLASVQSIILVTILVTGMMGFGISTPEAFADPAKGCENAEGASDGKTNNPHCEETGSGDGGDTSSTSGGDTSSGDGGDTSSGDGGDTSSGDGGDTSSGDGGDTSSGDGGDTSSTSGGQSSGSCDTNSDGVITAAELLAYTGTSIDWQAVIDSIEASLSGSDTNNNGLIETSAEFAELQRVAGC